jgi:hypothetical protein
MRPKLFPEVLLLRLPAGTLARLRAAASHHHTTTAEYTRQLVARAVAPRGRRRTPPHAKPTPALPPEGWPDFSGFPPMELPEVAAPDFSGLPPVELPEVAALDAALLRQREG